MTKDLKKDIGFLLLAIAFCFLVFAVTTAVVGSLAILGFHFCGFPL